MIPEKLKQLIILLTEKTLAKKAQWNKGSGPNQFKLSLDNGIAVTIGVWEVNWSDAYEIIVFNDNGVAILKHITDNETSIEDLNLMISLHKAASDQFFKVEETMDALISSISSQDIIGNANAEAPPSLPDEDDELPF